MYIEHPAETVAIAEVSVVHPEQQIAHPAHTPDSYIAPPPPPPPTPEQVAAATQAAKDRQDATDAKTNAKLQALANMTPVQVGTWVNNNVTTLAQAIDTIKTLAIVSSVLARRL